LATASAEATPKSGNRKSGAMEATASGTAPVTHQRKTQARTASMLRASRWAWAWAPPAPTLRSTSKHTAAAAAGPDATAGYLCASSARTHDDDDDEDGGRSLALSSRAGGGGSSGASTSSDELPPKLPRLSIAAATGCVRRGCGCVEASSFVLAGFVAAEVCLSGSKLQ